MTLDDPARLRAVAELLLVGGPFEERFDRITRTAQRLLDVPLAFLNLVDDEQLWVTSCVAPVGRSLARSEAFCSYAVAVADVLLVPDTLADERFAGLPIVAGPTAVRAYAGQPLRGPSGHVVGTLCVMDVRPRDWSPQHVGALRDLAAWAEEELAQGEVARRLSAGEQLRQVHEQVLDHAGQGIVGLDADGLVLVANPAAVALSGWSREQLVGRSLHETLHPRHTDGTPCTAADCPAGPAAVHAVDSVRLREQLERPDGTRFPAQLSCAAMRDVDTGAVLGAVVVFDDVTAQHAVDRMKDEFVSIVSHELRTPLTSLRGSLGLLAGGVLGELSSQGKQMADVALSSTERLVRLVDDILDLERLVAGQVVLERQDHPLPGLVATAVDAVAGTAAAADVAVRTDVPGETLWCDADRLVQVLVNLLGNAVKFSPPGSAVDLRAWRDGDDVHLEVADRGRGIPADQLERVFDRFAQVDASDSRDRGGTGLGLTIARSVVEQHGGTLKARSTVGEGTVLTAVLPQRHDPSPAWSAGRRTDDA